MWQPPSQIQFLSLRTWLWNSTSLMASSCLCLMSLATWSSLILSTRSSSSTWCLCRSSLRLSWASRWGDNSPNLSSWMHLWTAASKSGGERKTLLIDLLQEQSHCSRTVRSVTVKKRWWWPSIPCIHSCFFFLSDALISKLMSVHLIINRHFFPSLSGKDCRRDKYYGTLSPIILNMFKTICLDYVDTISYLICQ